MARCVGIAGGAVLCLLVTCGAAQETSGGQQHQSALDQLKALLLPVLEEAVTRSNSGWQLAQLAVQQARQQLQLDALASDVTELKLTARAAGGGGCAAERVQVTAPRSTESPPSADPPQTACEASPTPLPAGTGPYQEPAVRACARSCLQLRDQGGTRRDGVYWFTGMSVPVLCDFSHDGGGWTLLLTAKTGDGWDVLSALSRSPLSPTLTDNYSILKHADAIRDLGTGDRFAYRIETQAEKGRQRWGGVWLAPRSYSFVDETGTQTDVSRVRFFNSWNYKNTGIKKRMPWLNTGLHGTSPVLTTLTPSGDNWWGTLVPHETVTGYHHSPWIHPESTASGNVLYWMREDAV